MFYLSNKKGLKKRICYLSTSHSALHCLNCCVCERCLLEDFFLTDLIRWCRDFVKRHHICIVSQSPVLPKNGKKAGYLWCPLCCVGQQICRKLFTFITCFILFIKRIFHIFTSIKNHFVRKTESPGAASVNCTFTRAHLTEL